MISSRIGQCNGYLGLAQVSAIFRVILLPRLRNVHNTRWRSWDWPSRRLRLGRWLAALLLSTPLPVNLHELAEHLLGQRLLGLIAEGLATLRCVDGEQPYLELLVTRRQYRDGVAIRNANDFARERRSLGGEGG